MKLSWEDTDEIGWELADRYPEVDPLSLSFPKLRDLVMELEVFEDLKEKCTEAALEAIQMSWYEEVR